MSLFSRFAVRKSYLFYFSFSALLVLLFNNCGNFTSQQADTHSVSNQTQSSEPGLPVNALNPYVLQCIVDSDGVTVNPTLALAVQPSLDFNASGKLSSLDWNQDTDLVVMMDNNCVFDTNASDPILSYLNPEEATPELAQSVYVVKKETVANLKLFIAAALDSECLVSAEKNVVYKINALDPLFSSQRHLGSMGVTENFLNALPSGTDVDQVRVAVIDTGIDTANPDLANQLARDGGGKFIGKNTTSQSGDGFLTDSGFHGTHVAGLIGAQYSNGIGGSGVYGKNIKLYPVRASSDGESLTLASLAAGINWAVAQDVDIINMSVGSTSDASLTLKNALANAIGAGVTVVVAAGNNNKQLGIAAGLDKVYPAVYSVDFNGLITVGSYDVVSFKRSWFSNYSSTFVDILAPGSDSINGIYSTVPVSVDPNGYARKITSGNQTAPIEGTSMAAPMVAGALAAAISISKHTIPNSELETILKGAGSPNHANFNGLSVAAKYLNVPTLLNYIKVQMNGTPPPPTNPVLAISSQPMSKTAVLGEKVELSVSVVAPAGSIASYQWYRNDTPVGQNSSKLILDDLSQADGGVYRVTVSAGSASPATSQNAEVRVALAYCD